MSDALESIQRIAAGYQAAVYAKDVDAFVRLYAEDVGVFDLWGTWSYRGVAAWRGMVTEWFKSLGSERVVVEFAEWASTPSTDLATAHAFVTYRGVSAEGQELRSMCNRLTWVLQARNGIWQIVHEHTSAPIDFESFKPILKR